MRRWMPIILLMLVALLTAAQLWVPGVVNTRGGGDSPFLLLRTHQLAANLRAGVFPVRWMPDAAYGLGYPFFSYYAALPYYLAGGFVLAGVDILTALKLVQTLGFVLAALAMYGWMNEMTSKRGAAWLAAVAYTVAPFHLVNVYVRGDSLSEFYAFIFYPLILWSLGGISNLKSPTSPGDWRTTRWVWVSLSYAGLLLTHNLSAAIFSPFALLYLAIMTWRAEHNRWRVFWTGILAFGLGFLLSAWYLIPALAELKWVQLGPSTQDYFHYSNHFRTLNLVQKKWLFSYSTTAGHKVNSPFAMGLVQAAFAVLGGLVLVTQGLRRRLTAQWGFVLLGLAISTAMITPLSKPLWDHLPLLPVVQFPWRFLSVQALFAAAATAALVSFDVSRLTFDVSRLAFIILIALLLSGSVLLPLHPARLHITPADVTVERLQLYELFTQNIGTTIRYEWLPRTANPRPFTSDALIEPGAPPCAIPLDGASLDATLVERKPTRQTWHVQGAGGKIAFPLLYWPGWGARVDGEPVQVWPVEGSGYLALTVAPGEHTVVLRLGHTPVRAVAEVVSLMAAVVLLLVVCKSASLQMCKSASAQVGKWFIVSLFIVALFKFLPGGNPGTESDLTMDFVHMPYLHHNPEGVLSYTLSADELLPGDTLTVTLNWPYTATLRLVSPAAVRHPELEPLAETISNLQSPVSDTVTLHLPDDIPRGVYLLRLDSTYLRPVHVSRGPSLPPDASTLAPFGPDIRLHTAAVTQPAPDRLAVRLAWSAACPVAVNYQVSVRLFDANEQLRVSQDTQPGYGFLPTSLWRPGELVTDHYVLTLPDDLPPGGYHLQIVLYRMPTAAPVGQARVGDFALPLGQPFEAQPTPRSFYLPSLEHPLEVGFDGVIWLAGYEMQQSDDALHLTLWWQALETPPADYTVFVHLFDPATQTLVAQSDAQPRGRAYPTSWWIAGEVVSETVTLSLDGVPAGTYRLAVGLYDRTVTRLPATGPDGERLPDERVILPPEVRRER